MVDSKSTISLNKVILFLLVIMPIVESLNGLLLGHHISDIYRAGLGLLILVYIFCTGKYLHKQSFELLFLLLLYIGLTMFQFIFFHGDITAFKSDLKTTTRIIITPLYYAYFYVALVRKDIRKAELVKLLTTYAILYAVLIITPTLFHTGYITYDYQGTGFVMVGHGTGVGSKGFFVEINSLVGILVIFTFYTGQRALSFFKKGNLKNGVQFVLILLSLVMAEIITTTKTGIVVGVIYLIYFLPRSFFVLRKVITKKQRRILAELLSVLIVVLSPFIYQGFAKEVTLFIQRNQYFFDLFDGNLLKFITSSRSVFLEKTFKSINRADNSLFLHLFGGGYYIRLDKPFFGAGRRVTEMDWFDLYFSYGLVGIVAYITYFKESLFNLLNSKKNPVKIMLVVFIVYSLIAGHVIFNAMTTTILAVALAYFTDNKFGENDD